MPRAEDYQNERLVPSYSNSHAVGCPSVAAAASTDPFFAGPTSQQYYFFQIATAECEF